jgi:hypothetical protein
MPAHFQAAQNDFLALMNSLGKSHPKLSMNFLANLTQTLEDTQQPQLP